MHEDDDDENYDEDNADDTDNACHVASENFGLFK